MSAQHSNTNKLSRFIQYYLDTFKAAWPALNGRKISTSYKQAVELILVDQCSNVPKELLTGRLGKKLKTEQKTKSQ